MKRQHKLRILAGVLILGLLFSLVGFAWHDHWTDRQNQAHEIAELARAMGLPENNPIIIECQRIWLEDQSVGPTPVAADPVPEDEKPAPVIEAAQEKSVDLWNGVLPYEVTYDPDTEYLAVAFAKLVYGEFRGGWSQMEQAAIIQTVYERYYDGTFGSSLWGILTQPYQFAYYPSKPTVDDYGRDLVALARDVIYRNNLYQTGQYTRDQIGIVLGAGYRWYVGNGRNHKFYPQYSTYGACGTPWNWSLPNPYGT